MTCVVAAVCNVGSLLKQTLDLLVILRISVMILRPSQQAIKACPVWASLQGMTMVLQQHC